LGSSPGTRIDVYGSTVRILVRPLAARAAMLLGEHYCTPVFQETFARWKPAE